MPVALASAVPVKTDHGEASPHPTIPALVLILTMAPGIDSSMSPTPCRRFILSGHRTTSTETPMMRNSPMAALTIYDACRVRWVGLYLVLRDPYNLLGRGQRTSGHGE